MAWFCIRHFYSTLFNQRKVYVIDISFSICRGSMSEKSCRIYDNKKLAISIGILTVSLRAMATVFLVLALIFERRKDNKTENSDASYVDTFLWHSPHEMLFCSSVNLNASSLIRFLVILLCGCKQCTEQQSMIRVSLCTGWIRKVMRLKSDISTHFLVYNIQIKLKRCAKD